MPAQQDGVGQVTRASLFPGQGMVDLAVGDRLRAPRVSAGSISGDYSVSLPRCEQTLVSPRVENFPGRREHDAANRRVACQPGKLSHRQCGSIVKSGRLRSGQSLQIDCRGNDRQGWAELVPRDPRRHPLLPLYTELDMVSIFCSIFSIAYSQSRPLQDVRRRRLRTSRATSTRTSRASHTVQPPPPDPAHRGHPHTEAKGPSNPGTNASAVHRGVFRSQRPAHPWNEP